MTLARGVFNMQRQGGAVIGMGPEPARFPIAAGATRDRKAGLAGSLFVDR